MKNLFIFIILIQFASCGKDQNNSKNTQSHTLSHQESLFSNSEDGPLKFIKKIDLIDSLTKDSISSYEHLFNKYIINADFNQPAFNGEKLICEKSKNVHGVVEVFEEAFELGASKLSLDIELTEEDNIEVTVQCRVEDFNDRVVFIQKPTKLFKDLIIMEDRKLSDLGLKSNKLNRVGIIFFKDQSSLFIGSQSLSILAEKLISLNGSIKTFTEKEISADLGQPGKKGADLQIVSDIMEGEITMELSGQNGGSYIPSYPDGSSANKGKPADILGRGVRGSRARKCRDISLASNTATNGENGVDGAVGFNGGDMGVFSFTSKSKSDFQISSHGRPGLGSQGQIGQEGGLPGGFLPTVRRTSLQGYDEQSRAIRAHQCGVKPDYQASPGRAGNKGRDGSSGKPGERKLSIFKNGEQIEIFQY